ncbi:MAG: hypothetical protein SOZ27_07115 [Spirochaetia bacterium]|nr:hypothetical protein [Spirochaetia bacterium]
MVNRTALHALTRIIQLTEYFKCDNIIHKKVNESYIMSKPICPKCKTSKYVEDIGLCKGLGAIAGGASGYLGGAATGAKIGTAIGNCIPIPGLGTAIGAIAGTTIGAAAAGCATGAIAGKKVGEEVGPFRCTKCGFQDF